MVDLPTHVLNVIAMRPAVRRIALIHSVRRAPRPETSRCWQHLWALAAPNPRLIRAAPICQSLANTVGNIIVLPSTEFLFWCITHPVYGVKPVTHRCEGCRAPHELRSGLGAMG